MARRRADRSPEQFRIRISKYVDRTDRRLQEFSTEFPQEIARQIVENTPVKTGNLRASWYASWVGRVYRFTNGAAYAVFVEYGTVFMAPRYFVRSVIDRADEIARQVLARIKG